MGSLWQGEFVWRGSGYRRPQQALCKQLLKLQRGKKNCRLSSPFLPDHFKIRNWYKVELFEDPIICPKWQICKNTKQILGKFVWQALSEQVLKLQRDIKLSWISSSGFDRPFQDEIWFLNKPSDTKTKIKGWYKYIPLVGTFLKGFLAGHFKNTIFCQKFNVK